MTTELEYSEDYSDPEADVWIYNRAANPLPKPADYDGPMRATVEELFDSDEEPLQ